MPAPTTADEFVELVRKSRLVPEDLLISHLMRQESGDIRRAADGFLEAGLLTRYHLRQLEAGRHRGFFMGAYRLLGPLGKGGMGTVYLAEHTSLLRKVALKVFPPDQVADLSALERFYREGRAAAALDHPNIVGVHDICHADELHFIVMEYVEGLTLDRLVEERGPLPVEEAVGHVAQAAAGLRHAHENGIVHRDIKPGNLLLDRQGVVKILDMGLARFADARKDGPTGRLDDGAVIGTADYIAPEQALSSDVDIRADIYSLGGTLYTLLAGRTPYGGETATQKLLAHQFVDVADLSQIRKDIPRPLVDIVETMMAKRPADRYQSPAEVLAALAPWVPTVVSPASGVRPSSPVLESSAVRAESEVERRKKRWPVAVAAGIITVVAAVGISWGLLADGRTPATPPEPKGDAGEKAIYRLDLSGQAAFGQQLSGKVSLPGTGALRGWEMHRWGEQGSTRFGAVETDAGRALTLEQEGYAEGKWVLSDLPATTGRRSRLRFDYRTEGKGQCLICFGYADGTITDTFPFGPTGGEWRAGVVEVPACDSAVTSIDVTNGVVGAENRLSFRAFTLLDVGPRAGEQLVARQNWGDVGEFRLTMRHHTPLQKSGDLPSDWLLMAWRDDGVVEARRETAQDRPVLALRQAEGEPSLMLFWRPGRVRADRKYRLRILYRTEGVANTHLKVGEEGKEARDIATLPATWNFWTRREIDIAPTVDGVLQLEFHPIMPQPDQVCQVASVELVEVVER